MDNQFKPKDKVRSKVSSFGVYAGQLGEVVSIEGEIAIVKLDDGKVAKMHISVIEPA
jgi:hypothetical protein